MLKTFYSNLKSVPSVFRKLLLSWLLAVTIEYLLLPAVLKDLHTLDGLAEMSCLRTILLSVIFGGLLCFLDSPKTERWLLTGTFFILAAVSLSYNFSWPFLVANTIVLAILVLYALKGWGSKTRSTQIMEEKTPVVWYLLIIALAVIFFAFVSWWTVYRVYSFSTPTFDFGIFSQMFYNMKASGLPFTTVERDGLLSHFHVHVSPIYYLLLPFYVLFPKPATLQILQAAILASAVIPLWLIGKRKSLHPILRVLLCAVLLFYPAYSGGTSYDIHENAFLTPLLLWLFYGMDKKCVWLSALSGFLILMVKEDAAVYLAVIGIYYLLHGLLYKDRWEMFLGGGLTVIAIVWFVLVTNFLATVGDGVMTYRYQNFMFDGSGSLFSVIKAVLLCPMKAVLECVDQEKIQFILQTILPLAAIPLFTRRYERYLLLVPYILINLMSDYQYQHDIFFQYGYGSTACLVYLVAANLSDITPDYKRILALGMALCIGIATFFSTVVPKARIYPEKYTQYADYYTQLERTLDLIPEESSVAATTFYTTYLSQREILYDIQYASLEHILSTDYVALAPNYTRAYDKFAVDGENGYENFSVLLEVNGYTIFAQMGNSLVIYAKS